ncbi:MAG TPA: phage tail sheath subtilisin-like domain-containing protein [Micromonosporaceae bacterium]|nr:phage tail sheath subtilisin-like domain-containing protein [Micromonosporaceae bacterium]
MPVPLTYPGVYIEEIPSGVRTITGVATSIAAFIGRTLRGPVNDPIVINSFADFERQFGGLWVDSPMTYAVRDFYRNGGAQAVIVRLYKEDDGIPTTAFIELPAAAGTWQLDARSPGAWGTKLRARVDYDTATGSSDSFNLYIRDDATGEIESFRNLSITAGSPRQADKVLNNESNLVTASSLPSDRPDEHDAPSTTDPLWGDNGTNTAADDTAPVASDGVELDEDSFTLNTEGNKEGLFALEKADLFNLLCIPPHIPGGDIEDTLVGSAAAYCERRRAVLLVDPLSSWNDKSDAVGGVASIGTSSKNAALYFPRLRMPNPLRDNQLEDFVPCGTVAGIISRTDAQRGVWKAPAGLEATLVGVPALSVSLTDAENGELNPLGVNCLRTMPAAGRVVWGARTLQGSDRLASEWKYLPVRRTALFIEESLFRGTQWVVFEPNDEPLWAQIRLNLGAFMHDLFRQGAFAGAAPRDAYFVKCDKETTTQSDVNKGIVNIVVGFAPLKPAEFVVIKLQQMAGQIAT